MRTTTSRFLFGLSALSLLLAALVLVPGTRPAQAQSLSIEQTQLGNAFTVGATPAFDVRTSANEVTWAAQDYWGAEVAGGTAQVSDGALRLEAPVDEPGFYRLRVSVGQAEREQSAETTFAVLPEPTAPADDGFEFGVQTHFSQGWDPALTSLLELAGVESVRDQLSWSAIESAPGTYNFGASDGRFEKYMSALRESDIQLLANFGVSNPNYDDGATPYTAEAHQAYARFVQEVLKHYGDQIEQISVFNEPNLQKFGDAGGGPADATPENYYSLLEKTRRAVDDTAPDVTVAGPELAATITNTSIWRPWLERFFDLGGNDYIDSVSFHPYRDNCCAPEGLEDDVAVIREAMAGHGTDKPLWITEQGWPTNLVSEQDQAGYLLRTYAVAMRAGVTRFHWFNLMDNNGLTHGLVHPENSELGAYTPKPSYVAYAMMTSQLSGLTYDGTDRAPKGVESLRFGAGDDTTRVMWAPEKGKQATVALKTTGPVEVTDLMGVRRSLRPVDGKVSLTLTGDPMYVRGTVDSIHEDSRFGVDGEDSALSDGVPGTLTLENPTASERTATFTVSGDDHEVTAAAGQSAKQRIDVPGGVFSGRRVVRAEVSVDGRLTGLVADQVDVADDVTIRVVPRVAQVGGETSMNVDVTNHRRDTEQTVESLDWSLGGDSGSEQLGSVIEPGATKTIPISLPQKDNWTNYPVEATVQVAGMPALEQSGEIGFSPVVRQALTVDGDLSELADTPSLDLLEYGVVKRTGQQIPHDGPDDLSGPIWLTADESNLYVAGRITDDAHVNKGTGQVMREFDSLHIGLTKGLPGETDDFYEYILALTPDGPKARRNLAPVDEDFGPAEYVDVAVERDETRKTTTYEAAIPWDEMEQIAYEDGVLGLSAAAMDNDGADHIDREGWLEWGSGVSGAKDPALYRPVVLAR